MRNILILLILVTFFVGCQTPPRDVVKEEPKETEKMDRHSKELLENQLKQLNGDARDTARKLGPSALPLLRKYAADESPEVRALVLECYAQVKGEEAIAALSKGLEDEDINVRKTAVLMLHEVHGPVAAPRLREIIDQSSDAFVRGQAALLLGKIGNERDAAAIKKHLSDEKDKRAAKAMTLAVARLEDGEARKKVLANLLNTNALARYNAISDFEYLANPALMSKLQPLLSDVQRVRNVGTEPYPVWHRVCDRAVEAVAALMPGRLSFKVGFRTYTAEQIQEARKLIANVQPAGRKEGNVLTAAQLKLTYHGRQTKPIPSVVLVTRGHTLDMDAFEQFCVPGLSYGNDYLGNLVRVFVSLVEMKAVLDIVQKVPHLTEINRAQVWVSCTVILSRGSGEHQGNYLLFDRPQSKQLVSAMAKVLEPDNEASRIALERWQAML